MESMRDIDRAMEREIAKGSCPLKFVRIEFGGSPYQEIASREKLLECNAALYSRRKKHFIFDSLNTITALSFH